MSESGGDGEATVEKEDTSFLVQSSFATFFCDNEYPVNTVTAASVL